MNQPLNIIINACNEPQAARLIARICEQSRKEDNVLVLSYRSTREYLAMLSAMQAAYRNLAVIELNAISSLMDHRNFAQELFPRNSWLVYLDADEWVTESFLDAIRDMAHRPESADVILLRRANMMHEGQLRIPELEWSARETDYQAWPDLQARVLRNIPENLWVVQDGHEVIRFNRADECFRPGATIIHHKDKRSYSNATYDKAKLPSIRMIPPDGFFRGEFKWDSYVWEEVVANNCYRMPVAFLPDDVVIDVGAHIGCFSYAAIMRGAGKVVSIEAHPQNSAKRSSNLQGFANSVELFGAVWPDESAKFSMPLFEKSDDNTGGASLVASEEQSIPVFALDKIIEQHAINSRIAFLKVDCEGSEYRILMDSKKLSLIETIALEYHPHAVQSSATVVDLENFLRAQGFHLIKQQVSDGFGYLWAVNKNRF